MNVFGTVFNKDIVGLDWNHTQCCDYVIDFLRSRPRCRAITLQSVSASFAVFLMSFKRKFRVILKLRLAFFPSSAMGCCQY